MVKKIGYLKLGKQIKLKKEHGIANGDYDSRQLLKLLSKHFPNDEFQIIGQHDLDSLRTSEYKAMFPNQNVKPHSMIPESKKMQVLDYTICISGPRMLPDVYLNQIDVLNSFGGILIEVSHDIRFSLVQFKELNRMPIICLNQYYCQSFNSETFASVKSIYAYQELLYLFEKEFNPIPDNFIDSLESKTDMLVISTQAPGFPFRENEIKKYILDSDIKAHFWGNFDMGLDFKGPYKYEDLGKVCENYKYSFLVPILPEYATSKYVEMIHHNVFPFTHPDYDSQRKTLLKNVSMHRAGSPQELSAKIESLNLTPRTFCELMKTYKALISNPDFYSGKFLADIFKRWIK